MFSTAVRRAALPVLAAGAYAAFVRPRLLRWGTTTAEEAAAEYPGDDLVEDAKARSTMATSLPAPPEEVWPWLVQMGCGRAGWYSWDLLDHGGRPSANRVHPEWQDLAAGEHLPTVPSGASYFLVELVDAPRTLLQHRQFRNLRHRVKKGAEPAPEIRVAAEKPAPADPRAS